jgi:acetyl-CoA acyltransferase 2
VFKITPIEIKGKKVVPRIHRLMKSPGDSQSLAFLAQGPEPFVVDEHPRPESTPEALAKLPTVFQKDNGRVTAGSASGICDGAASLVIASEAACKAHSLKPLVRVAGWAVAGVDPSIMGIGPAPAIRKVGAAPGRSPMVQ